MSPSEGKDLTLEEKHKWFRGTARAELRHLQFEGSQRCIDWKNVDRLMRVFADVGCDRLTPEHHVPVLVSERDLEAALLDAGVPLAHLLQPFHPDPPMLRFPDEVKLVCLHGQHRLLVADRFLPVKERWWTIDIYTPDLPASAQTQIREQHSNSQDYSDGEKFRHICYYRQVKDLVSERRWVSMLSRFKQAVLKAIQNDSLLSQALERLLPYPGIWKDFNFSLFHRVRSWRCREEILRYLEAVHTCWNEASGNDPRLRSSVDTITVAHLQRLIPKHSGRDQERIRALFAYGEVFPSVLEESDRSRILQAVFSLQHKILSFRTLSEDSKYLIPIKDGMQSLVDLMQGESIEAGMRRIHSQIAQTGVQVGEDEFRHLEAAPCDAAWFGYLQLVLFCIRNFNSAHTAGNRRGLRRNIPCGRQRPLPAPKYAHLTSTEMWNRLATLAYRLGFRLRNMDNVSRQNGERQTTAQSRSQGSQALRKRDLNGGEDGSQAHTDNKSLRVETSISAISTDFVSGTTKFSHRPTTFETPEFQDKAYAQFYLPTLCQLPEEPAKYVVTYFGELREVLCAFYGRDLGLPWQRLQETAATTAEESTFLPIAQNKSGPPSDNLHGALAYQAQETPTLNRVRNFSSDRACNGQELQNIQRLQDPAEGYRYIVEDTLRMLEGHQGNEPSVSWESLDGLTCGSFTSKLQNLNRECIQYARVAFWKLEERVYFTVEKDIQLIRRLARRIANKDIGGVITRQLFGVVTNDRFKFCAPSSLPTPVDETDAEDFANIIFLLDAPYADRCSTWNMVLDGHLFSQNSCLALSSDLAASSSAKRPRSLASSIYPDSQSEDRPYQRRRF